MVIKEAPQCRQGIHNWKEAGEEQRIPRTWLGFRRYFLTWHCGILMLRVKNVQPVQCQDCGKEGLQDAVGHVNVAQCSECGEVNTGPILI